MYAETLRISGEISASPAFIAASPDAGGAPRFDASGCAPAGAAAANAPANPPFSSRRRIAWNWSSLMDGLPLRVEPRQRGRRCKYSRLSPDFDLLFLGF